MRKTWLSLQRGSTICSSTAKDSLNLSRNQWEHQDLHTPYAACSTAKLLEAAKRCRDTDWRGNHSIIVNEANGNAGRSNNKCLVEDELVVPQERPCKSFIHVVAGN